MALVYKICSANLWRKAEKAGVFAGAAIDLADGFIHFSTGPQVHETAAKHFEDQDNLVLVAVDPDTLGVALRWEPSRGGDLFPHLYKPLPLSAVRWVRPLPIAGGVHVFPDDLP